MADGPGRADLAALGFPDYYVDQDGAVYSVKSGTAKKLKPWRAGKGGHLAVSLRSSRGETRKTLVHRLVAIAFIGAAPPGKPNVLHRDGNPVHNSVGNLYYGDQADNAADMVRHGRCFPKEHPGMLPRGDAHHLRRNPSLAARGEAVACAKLRTCDVRAIRAALNGGALPSALAREHGVTVQNICRIRDRLTWRHVA